MSNRNHVTRIAAASGIIALGLAALIVYMMRANALVEPAPVVESPEISACDHCNVVLISLDTFRADRVAAFGSELGLMKNLDRIAQESVVMERAYSNAFYTTPSHMTLFTSLYPQTHQVAGIEIGLPRSPKLPAGEHALDSKFKTMAETLRGEGYRTVWAGPVDFRHLSFKLGFSRGFDEIYPSMFDRGLAFGQKKVAGFDVAALKDVLNDKSKPIFLFLHSYVSHLPYVRTSVAPGYDGSDVNVVPYGERRLLAEAGAAIRRDPGEFFKAPDMTALKDPSLVASACTKFSDMRECFASLISVDRFMHALGQWQLGRARLIIDSQNPSALAEKREFVRGYNVNARYSDQQIGQLWETLRKNIDLEHTIVIFFSDHGEELFEHGEGGHSSFYDHTIHIPLLMHFPGKARARSRAPVSLVDVLPSLLSVLKVAVPAQAQGKTFLTTQNSTAKPHHFVFGFSLGNDYVRSADWKLLRFWDGGEALFHLAGDRSEKKNVIDEKQAETASALKELREARGQWETEQALAPQ
jgi:arylsulfatase A-like enzyme